MSFKIVTHTLAADLETSGTVNISYPPGTSLGTFRGGQDHKLIANQTVFSSPVDFTLTFAATYVTLTYKRSTTIVSGTDIVVQLDILGESDGRPNDVSDVHNTILSPVVLINLGSPDTADPNGVVESQACTASGGLATGINGALLADDGLSAEFDVPRNVVAGWTTTAVLTVTGEDDYGNVLVESSASGTSLAGKKAFKKVTDVSTSVNITGLTVGTGDVLGLPVFIPSSGHLLVEMEDGAAPTAGTLVAGVTVTPTATTGDPRGTYDPNSACNGAKGFQLLFSLPDPEYRGAPQYAG